MPKVKPVEPDPWVPKPPVRLCCGERHFGVRCGDGKVMCCLCFERFEIQELNVTEDGHYEDVCRDCAEADRR